MHEVEQAPGIQEPRPAPPPPSLRALLVRNLVSTLVAVVVVGAVAVAALLAADAAGDELFEEVIPARRTNQLLLQHMLDADTGLRGHLETGEASYLTTYETARRTFAVTLAEQRARTALSSEVAALVDEQGELGAAWFDRYARPLVDGATVDTEVGRSILDDFRAANQEVTRLLEVDRTRLGDRLELLPMVAVTTVVVIALGFVVVTIVQGRRVRRLVVGPLEELRTTVASLERGERGARTDVTATVEIEAVGHAINELADESQRHLAASERRLEVERRLQALTTSIHQVLAASSMLDEVAAELGRLLSVQRVLVLALDDDGDAARPLADWCSPSGTGRAPAVDDPESLTLLATDRYRRHVTADQALYLGDVASAELSADLTAALDRQRATALAVCPMRAGAEVLGAIVLLATDGPRAWPSEDRRAAEAVATEIATALDHARRYQRELDMVEKLRSLDKAKDDFVSTVSHELRTPLTSIVGYLELLRDGDAGPISEDQDHMLAVVERNSERLLGLIADLLLLSRIDSGRLGIDARPVRLAALVTDVVRAVAPDTARRGQTVEVDVDLGSSEVSGDVTQLEQVLLNLLSNAAKFTPDGGRITVTAHGADDDGVEIVVTDTGIGIPEAEQDQLFTRFFRSSNAQAGAIPGTGLGLAIVRGIVERHHGRIAVESTSGVGTRVAIWLPCATGAPDDEHRLAPETVTS